MKTHKGRREKDSEKGTVCPRGIVLALSSSSWLNGITSVTFVERVFTCSLEGCCTGVLRRDQTEANDPDGNETEFALCRSPQTSQTRPRPLFFLFPLPWIFSHLRKPLLSISRSPPFSLDSSPATLWHVASDQWQLSVFCRYIHQIRYIDNINA